MRIPTTKILFPLIVFAIFLSSCKKNRNLSVTGKVIGTDGLPIRGVLVTDVGDASNTDFTNSNGDYEITVRGGSSLSFSKSGYNLAEVAIDGNTEVNFTLGYNPFPEYFYTAGNQVTDPLWSNSIAPGLSDWGSFSVPTDPWFEQTTYKGAVDPMAVRPWYADWSYFSRIIEGNPHSAGLNGGSVSVTVTDGNLSSADTIYWTNDTTYLLQGLVFVDPGQVLKIEAGTVIKGKLGSGANAAALIITRGAKIMAEGSATAPIIFTYNLDFGGSDVDAVGRWGGLIILGNATTNLVAGDERVIEGIPPTEERGKYGGNNDADNSGVLRYVSIRHGGTSIGTGSEINGLTLAGVGSGTTIEYVEVVANKDDGIEWFGGTVNAKWLIVSSCGDDALDSDHGYRGKNQYVILHQGSQEEGSAGEHDGGPIDCETCEPYSTPIFYNVTALGNPKRPALVFRDNAGGEYHNSIFTGFRDGVRIEDLTDQSQDSYKQWENGNLKLEHNIFHDIKVGKTGAEIFKVD